MNDALKFISKGTKVIVFEGLTLQERKMVSPDDSGEQWASVCFTEGKGRLFKPLCGNGKTYRVTFEELPE